MLADPQHALDLHATAELAADGTVPAQRPRRSGTGSGKVGPDDPCAPAHRRGRRASTGVARVPGLGARSMAAVDQWLADLAPGATVTVTPVVDLAEQISVNAYEAPDRLRRQVEERDHDGCRFPWCGRQGRSRPRPHRALRRPRRRRPTRSDVDGRTSRGCAVSTIG